LGGAVLDTGHWGGYNLNLFLPYFTLPIAMHLTVKNCRTKLIQGDITNQEVDTIVNAANASLVGGAAWTG
jgi:hypothetical protein